MLFWQEEKSCQAITCFVKHARAFSLPTQHNRKLLRPVMRPVGRKAGLAKPGDQLWMKLLHMSFIPASPDRRFGHHLRAKLCWMLPGLNFDGNRNGVLGQDSSAISEEFDKTYWATRIFLQIERIGTMELAQVGPSWNCPYLSMECIPFWFPVQRKPAWQKRPWHRRRCKGGWVDHELGVTAHMISENLTPATPHG